MGGRFSITTSAVMPCAPPAKRRSALNGGTPDITALRLSNGRGF
jgi:hypothetical protein